MSTYGPDRELEIYAQMGTSTPRFPFAYAEWERRAKEVLSPPAYDYVAGGAGAEETMRANREAFYRWQIWPHMLQGPADRELQVTVLGTTASAPVLLAPIGVQSIVHAEAELAPARAAAALGIPFVLSTVSSVSIEEVAQAMGEAPRWFQLYPGKDREVAASMVHRAEAAGYSAVMVTLDTTMLGWRPRDLQYAYLPFLQAEGIVNYLSDPVVRSRLEQAPEENIAAATMYVIATFTNPALSWDDIDYIRQQTRLPLLLKGILHPRDALTALEHGADGLVISNHGGRQVDGAVAALDALNAVSKAVGGRVPLLMDSGVRSGADVLKALALGASAVLIGRPYMYALAVGGEEGVREYLRNLLADLDLQMALSGCRSIAEVGPTLVNPRDRAPAPSDPS
jgi:lactate 2-monooxygenase